MPRPKIEPAPTRSKVHLQFTEIIDRSTLGQAWIAKRAGYSQADISNLRLRRNSYGAELKRALTFYEDVAEALGYDLKLVPKGQRSSNDA